MNSRNALLTHLTVSDGHYSNSRGSFTNLGLVRDNIEYSTTGVTREDTSRLPFSVDCREQERPGCLGSLATPRATSVIGDKVFG